MEKITLLFFMLMVLMVACENVDLNNVSDEDLTRLSDKLVECNKPYMRLGTGCCLDKDDNKICDDDEDSDSITPKMETEIATTLPDLKQITSIETATKKALNYINNNLLEKGEKATLI